MGRMDRFRVEPVFEEAAARERYAGAERDWTIPPVEERSGRSDDPDAEMLDIAHQLEAAYAALEQAHPSEPESLPEPFFDAQEYVRTERAPAQLPFEPVDIERTMSTMRANWSDALSADSETVFSAAAPSTAPQARGTVGTAASRDGPLGRYGSLALIASSIALAVGTGVGYLMGRSDSVESGAKIQVNAQGGPQLRLDYDLSSKRPIK
ncbi:MAG: hypothetical protein ACXWUB_04695 [Burkholderiales bacterium]